MKMNFIKKIEIEKLFGFYDYIIERKESEYSPLIILYGDNGCGKTTILELIFNLFSFSEGKGQKSKIAKIKFKKIKIILDDNIELIAERKILDNADYNFIIIKNKIELFSLQLKTNEDMNIIFSEHTKKDGLIFKKMMDFLKNLDITVHYLTDKRELYSDTSLGSKFRKSNDKYNKNIDNFFNDEISNEKNIELVESINILERWIRGKVLWTNRANDLGTHSIYEDLIKRSINNNVEFTNEKAKETLKKFMLVSEKNVEFSKYGLSSKMETDNIYKIIEINKEKKFDHNLVYTLIEAYTESLDNKLINIEKIQGLIDFLLESLNDYFQNKEIKYDLDNGFSIISKDTSERIAIKNLSSGEKQLLLLFSNIIISSDNTSIYIIDEPEISLNIKWQRKLISTLLNLLDKNSTQFIIATHSIELLTHYKSSINKIIHISPLKDLHVL
jgi:predicted ATPase